MEIKMNFDIRWLKIITLMFFSQSIIIGIFAVFLYYTINEITGNSVASGGLAYCVPTFFAGLLMSRTSNKSAVYVLTKAYFGTFYKIAITICLFIYVFKNIPIDISVFLGAYLIAFVTQSAMSYFLHKSN